MNSPIRYRKRLLHAGLSVALALALFALPKRDIPVIDQQADDYFESAIAQAGLAYAACRVVNATVSVVEHSQIQLEPMGMGISLAVGQVLDPIDDMTERLSTVLVTAIVSLGIQKLAYEIGVSLAPDLLAIVLVLYAILTLLPWTNTQRAQALLARLGALILMARFLLPLTSWANQFLLERYFADEIQQATQALTVYSGNLDTFQEIEFPAYDGVFGTIDNSVAFVQQHTKALKSTLSTIIQNLGDIINHLLTLTALFAGIFVIQVILIPLAVLWLLVKGVNQLFP